MTSQNDARDAAENRFRKVEKRAWLLAKRDFPYLHITLSTRANASMIRMSSNQPKFIRTGGQRRKERTPSVRLIDQTPLIKQSEVPILVKRRKKEEIIEDMDTSLAPSTHKDRKSAPRSVINKTLIEQEDKPQWIVPNRLSEDKQRTHCFLCQETGSTKNPLLRCEITFEKKTRCSTRFHENCINSYNGGQYDYAQIVNDQRVSCCPLHNCHMCFMNRRQSTAAAGALQQCAYCYRCFHHECLPSSLEEAEGFMLEWTEDDTRQVELAQNRCICNTHQMNSNDIVKKPGMRIKFCIECCEGESESAGKLIDCENCLRVFHKKCHRYPNVVGINEINDGTRKELCEACILGDVIRADEYCIAYWKNSWYPCQAVKPDDYPNQYRSRDKYGKKNGDPGFITVKWLGYHNIFNVIPYQYIIALFAGSYNLMGKKMSDIKSKQAWKDLEKKYEDTDIPTPFPKNNPALLAPVTKHIAIKSSVYFSDGAKSFELIQNEHSMCDCPAGGIDRCSDSLVCSNRSASMECPPECDEYGCNNRNMSKRLTCETVEVQQVPGKGRGLFATDFIKKGTFIAEYAGEIIDYDEKIRRSQLAANSKNDEQHHYMMSINKGRSVDCKNKGNVARFINHSCDPNCLVRTYMVPIVRVGKNYKYDERVHVIAIKDIAKDEEISFNYNMREYESGGDIPPCYCGTAVCTGKLGGRVIKKTSPKVKRGKKKRRAPLKRRNGKDTVSSQVSPAGSDKSHTLSMSNTNSRSVTPMKASKVQAKTTRTRRAEKTMISRIIKNIKLRPVVAASNQNHYKELDTKQSLAPDMKTSIPAKQTRATRRRKPLTEKQPEHNSI